jgi:hypothetical protein
MVDPSVQSGTISFAGCSDDWNFGYRDRDGGTMLANSLDHAFRLRGFGRYFGVIVMVRVGVNMTVLVIESFKKMVNPMRLRRRQSQNE